MAVVPWFRGISWIMGQTWSWLGESPSQQGSTVRVSWITGPDLESARGQPSEDWDRSCTGDRWVAPSQERRGPPLQFSICKEGRMDRVFRDRVSCSSFPELE